MMSWHVRGESKCGKVEQRPGGAAIFVVEFPDTKEKKKRKRWAHYESRLRCGRGERGDTAQCTGDAGLSPARSADTERGHARRLTWSGRGPNRRPIWARHKMGTPSPTWRHWEVRAVGARASARRGGLSVRSARPAAHTAAMRARRPPRLTAQFDASANGRADGWRDRRRRPLRRTDVR